MADLMDIPQLLAVLENAERGCRQEHESRKASFVWAKTANEWKGKADGIRFAIDTVTSLFTDDERSSEEKAEEWMIAEGMTAESLAVKCLGLIHGLRYDGLGNCAECGKPYPCGSRQILDHVDQWKEEIAEKKRSA